MLYTYTVITENYDRLKPITVPIRPSERYICFSDRPRYQAPWIIQPIPPVTLDQRRASRIPKILPHLVMPEATESIYMDGAFSLSMSARQAFSTIGDADIGLFAHPTNKSIHDEHQFYKNLHGYIPDDVEAEYQKYVSQGLPITGQFYAGGVILRKHNDKVKEFNECWMEAHMSGSTNDQFSLYYAVVTTGVKVKILGPDNLWDFRFGYHLHAHEGGEGNSPYVKDNEEWKDRINCIKGFFE